MHQGWGFCASEAGFCASGIGVLCIRVEVLCIKDRSFLHWGGGGRDFVH